MASATFAIQCQVGRCAVKSDGPRALALRSSSYDAMFNRIVGLIDEAQRISARAVNATMTATYWLIGRHIVQFEQGGKSKAQYGAELIGRLASDLTARFGRGFTRSNLFNMRAFYLANLRIVQTLSGQSGATGKIQTTSGKSRASIESSRKKRQTASGQLSVRELAQAFSAAVVSLRPAAFRN